MTLELIAYILGGLTIGSALMVVLSNHPIRSVLYLVITFFFISGHFLLMNAQFLAIVNIIVYAGAIMVLFLFTLMLLNLNQSDEPNSKNYLSLSAIIGGGSLLLILIAALRDEFTFNEAIHENYSGLVENLGNTLFTKYLVPFEISSILFISAMVGAVLLAKRENQQID
ncbi:MAG: NADH-quinone oxidoreductase subunit J [Bacteroidetes bacterium]|nr:NADH-quinone oxidoreductase subunit J [Bacteroidota bacterium]